MTIERTLETQQHRLLRIVAGLLVVVGVLTIGPVSRRFSEWSLEFVGSLLSRAEAAVRYLVMTQACLMVDSSGLDIKRSQIGVPFTAEWAADDATRSLVEYQQRLRRLRAVLTNLPRYALRLLRQIAKRTRCTTERRSPRYAICRSMSLQPWRQDTNRIERPPDKAAPEKSVHIPSPDYRAEGAVGCFAQPESTLLSYRALR